MKSSFGSGDIRKIKNQSPHFLPWFSSSASVYIVVLDLIDPIFRIDPTNPMDTIIDH